VFRPFLCARTPSLGQRRGPADSAAAVGDVRAMLTLALAFASAFIFCQLQVPFGLVDGVSTEEQSWLGRQESSHVFSFPPFFLFSLFFFNNLRLY